MPRRQTDVASGPILRRAQPYAPFALRLPAPPGWKSRDEGMTIQKGQDGQDA